MNRRMLSREEAAEALGVGLATVKRCIQDGSLESVKVRGRRLVPVSVIEELTKDRATPEPEPEPISVEQAVRVLLEAGIQSAEVQAAMRKLNQLPVPK